MGRGGGLGVGLGHWVSYLWHTQEALCMAGGRGLCAKSHGYHHECVAFPVPADPPTDRPTKQPNPRLPAQHGVGTARGGNAVKAAVRQLHILPTLCAWCVRRRRRGGGGGEGGFSHASPSSLTSLISSHGGQVAGKTSGTTQQYQCINVNI